MSEPKLTAKFANLQKPEPAATNQTEQRWRTMQSRGYWESPSRVARYYNVIRTAPPGWKAPEWLDVDAVNTAYAYMRERNGDKPWQEWDYLPETDPGSTYLRSLSAPPDNMLWPGEVGDIRNRNRWPEELRNLLPDKNRALTEEEQALLQSGGILTPDQIAQQQPFGSWEDLPAWQQRILGLLAPQSEAADRPEWTRMTAAGIQGAIAGMGGMAAGGLLGPAGAIAGAFLVGVPVGIASYFGQQIPVLSEALNMFNQLALGLEKTAGVGSQLLSADDWRKILDDLPNAWQAGSFFYETSGAGNTLLNLVSNTGRAGQGEVWQFQKGLSAPQQAGAPIGAEGMARYRKMLAEGATMDELYADVYQNYGFSGVVGDLVVQSILDPLNLAPYAGGKMASGVAKLAGNERLSVAFKQGVGNPLIDMLPPVVQQLASKATGVPGSTGLMASFDLYKDWVRQGTFPAGVPKVMPEDLSAYEKRIAGLTPEGKIADIQPRPVVEGKKTLGTWLNHLSTLTDDSRAHIFLNILHDNVNAMMTTAEGNPGKMVDILHKLVGNREFDAGDPAAELLASPAIASIRDGLKAALDAGTADEMLASWTAAADRRVLLMNVAKALGEEPARVLELMETHPDALMARLNDKAPAIGQPDFLKKMLGVFVGDDALPWNANQFQAELSIHLFDKMDDWIARTYNLKPDGAVMRLSQVMKSVQSLMLLSFNPGYFINNELNNVVTRAAEGMWGYMLPAQINKFMDRFGVKPARMDVGIGAAETGTPYESGKVGIAQAMQANDAIAKAHKVVTKFGNKVGIFSNLSSAFESIESRQATVIAMKRFWGKYWKKGIGLRQMPPQMEAMLDSQYPGMKETIYQAAEAGMNMEEINKALFAGLIQPSVRETINEVSRAISPDNPERISDLMTHLGLDDELEKRLRNATTADDVDAAFNWMEGDMQRRVNEMIARIVIVRAEDVKNQVKAERIPGVLNIFGDMSIEMAKRWIDSRHEWDQLYARHDSMDYAAWEKAVEELDTKQDQDWKNINQWELQTYKGIIEALGLNDPRGARYIEEIGKVHDTWRKFYEERRKKIAAVKRSVVKKQGETWADFSNRKAVAWDKLQDELEELYIKHSDIERKAQRQMDNLFAEMFGQYTGWDVAAAKTWRQSIDEMRTELIEMQREFRRKTRDMLPAEKDEAYIEFNKEYNGLIARMKQAEQQGVFEVMKQPAPPATEIPIPEATPRVKPGGDIRDGMTIEQRQQYDDLLAKGVPPETITVDKDGLVSAPAPEAVPGRAVMDLAKKYGVVGKDGEAVAKYALNVINKNAGVKYDNLNVVPIDVAEAAFKAHQAKHASEGAKASAKRVIDAQEIVDMAEAQAREAKLTERGQMTRRAVRESLLHALGGDELATEATMMLMDSHADVWARGHKWTAGDNTRDAWYATHIAKILNGDEIAPDSTLIGLEQLTAVEGTRVRLQRAEQEYKRLYDQVPLIEGKSFTAWEAAYQASGGVDQRIPLEVWSAIYELNTARFDFEMMQWIDANGKEFNFRSIYDYLNWRYGTKFENVKKDGLKVSWTADGSAGDRMFINDADAKRFADGLLYGQFLYQQANTIQALTLPWYLNGRNINAAFANFIRNTKVVDERGFPLLVYHGTNNGNFTEFSEAYDSGHNLMDRGFYMTNDPELSGRYTTEEGGAILPVFVNIENPLDMTRADSVQRFAEDAYGLLRENPGKYGLFGNAQFEVLSNLNAIIYGSMIPNETNLLNAFYKDGAKIGKLARDLGRDGIIHSGWQYRDGVDRRIYVAFTPGQIKSAFNSGGWNRNNPNILMQEQQTWYYSQLQNVIETKMPNKASKEQIMGILKGQVKADELNTTGFEKWLSEQKGSITKQQVMDYLTENQVEVNEVVKGGEQAASIKAETKRLADLVTEASSETANARAAILSAMEERGVQGDVFNNAELAKTHGLTDLVAQYKEWAEVSRGRKETLDKFVNENTIDQTKYRNYVLPGGQNYRELLMTLPTKDTGKKKWQLVYPSGQKMFTPFNSEAEARSMLAEAFPDGTDLDVVQIDEPVIEGYKGPHWSEPNVLAHVRFDDRVDADGKRVLFVEEIQSDWHQAGREKGYQREIDPKKITAKYFPAQPGQDPSIYPGYWESYDQFGEMVGRHAGDWEEAEVLEQARSYVAVPSVFERDKVPAAPFSKSWEELSVKRIIRWAAENGYDRVAWTTGKMQADRYNLAKQVDWIASTRTQSGSYRVEGVKQGGHVLFDEILEADKLPGAVGVDLAKKIVSSPGGQQKWTGQDLTVGGEGMHAFYDVMLPNIVNKYVKKWGAKVGETKIVSFRDENHQQAIFSTRDSAETYLKLNPAEGRYISEERLNGVWSVREKNHVVARGGEFADITHSFDITPAMRESVMTQGQPLFQKAKGSFQLLDDGRAVIRAFNAADVSTMVLEIGHVFRRDLGDVDLDVVAKLGGLNDAAEFRDLETRFFDGTLQKGDPDYQRYVTAEEGFARGWELYLAEGRAPTPQLRSVFRRFTNWMLDIYKNLKRFMGRTTGAEQQAEFKGVNLSATVNGISLREIFDRLLTDDTSRPADFETMVAKRAADLKSEGRNHRFSPDELRARAERELVGQVLTGFKNLDDAKEAANMLDADGEGGLAQTEDGTLYDSATAWDAIQAVERRPEIAPWAEVRQMKGITTTARGIANLNNQYEFQFKVIDLSDLQASDKWDGEKIIPNPVYPQELQPRIRSEQQSRAQVDEIARNLVPDELLYDARALDRGAPIVGPDNFVESGNGRTLALARAAEMYPERFEAYRQALIAKLPELGIDPAQLDGMTRPVLVRERLTAVDRTTFAGDANKPVALKMNPMEVALNDARMISDQSLVNLEVGDNETIESAVQSARNASFVQNWLKQLSDNERGELSDNGQINSVGVMRLINALFAKVYTGAAGERLLRAFTMSMDTGVRNAQSAIMASLPQMARMEGMIAAGVRNADLSLAEDVAAAVDKMASIRASGKMTVTDFLNQTSFLGEDLTPTQRRLLEFIAGQRQPKRIREMLREYALQVIDHEPDPNQMSLFGEATGQTKEQILNATIKGLEPEAAEGGLFAAQPDLAAAAEPAAAVQTDELAGPQPGGSEVRGGETAGAGAAQPTVKEPWQMTRAEWEQTPRAKELIEEAKRLILKDAEYYATRGGDLPEAEKAYKEIYENVKRGIYNELQQDRIEAELMYSDRWQSVRKALVEGKPVPPEVLTDYPDEAFNKGRPTSFEQLVENGWLEVEAPPPARITFVPLKNNDAAIASVGRRNVFILNQVSGENNSIANFNQGYINSIALTPAEFTEAKLRGDFITINMTDQMIRTTGETIWLYTDEAAARANAKELADAGEAVDGIDWLAPEQISANFAGTQVVRTHVFNYGGQTVIGKVYQDGLPVAWLPANLDGVAFDTRGGQARLLGMDLNDPAKWVYEMDGDAHSFDPTKPALRGQEDAPSLFQDDANPVGDVAQGGTPTIQEQGMAMDQINKELLRPAFRQMREAHKNKIGARGFKMDNLSEDSQRAVRGYLNQVKVDMASAKLATMNYGTQMRDAALLNYSRRFGADSIAQMIFPYEFWYTRTLMNWGKRIIDRPAWFATYARYKQAQERMEREGMPSRLRGKVRLPMPWMPEWMGGGLWVEPLRQLFPPESFFSPMEQFANNQTRLDSTAQGILADMQKNGEISKTEMQEAINTRAGSLWEQALKQAEIDENQDSSPAGLVNMMMSPALWWSIPSALMKGKPETISTLPITRTAQSIETALEGTPFDLIGKAAGLAAKPETAIRKAAGLSEFGQWGDYYIDRQLANMAADGAITAEQARIAMTERAGNPAFQQAYQRVRQEMMLRTPGAASLQRLLNGDLKGAIESLPQLFFSGGLFPEGELKLRGDKPEYNNAWAKYKNGDPDALNQFFAEHPEYEARLALYDEPEERLKQFLISEVWDRYMGLSKADRGKAVKVMGQDFIDAFLEETTRAPENVPVEKLARWSWMLGGAVPKTPETQNLPQPEPVEPYPPAVSPAVDTYYAARDEKYPDITALQEIYYALPKAQRRAYLATVPRLKEYWEWKKEYARKNPAVTPYFDDQKNTLDPDTIAEFNEPLLRQLIAHYLGGEKLGSGATADLYRIWQGSGEPGASFEDWLETVVKTSFMQ